MFSNYVPKKDKGGWYKREITPLKSLNNSYPKYVLTLDEAPIKDDEGIMIIYALDWLINKDL